MSVFKSYYKKGLWILFFVLAASNLIIWQAVFEKESEPDLAVYFLNVGQGDSIFIQARDGTQVLIDGGPNSQVLSKLGSVMPYYDRSIDAVILTHPHKDHVSGLIEVLKRYEVGAVFESGMEYNTSEAGEFERLIFSKGVKKIDVKGPTKLSFFNGGEIKFLYPDVSFEGRSLKNAHDAMLVAELIFESKKIMFMGDAEKGLEAALSWRGLIDDVDVLKVGHHGSKNSSSDVFLRKVKPEYSVISVGKNNYGHPTSEAMTRLASVGSKIFRTDRDGTVIFEITGGAISWYFE
ncbi:MBL fold metallo-hydrolase [Candidatus Giovannonibacteria bacterium]|nr:MBL fold metallo-hydrolase [Candidatus Giovannonibacteria bacterium]